MTVKRLHSINQKAAGHLGGGVRTPCTLPLDPPLNKAKNLYSSSEVGTVADSLYVLVFASSEAIHFFSQPLLTAKFAF